MKAKVILYGWALSWLSLFAGIGTMEHGSVLTGSLLLFGPFLLQLHVDR
ncbi:MAG: hypothetical protein V8T16_08865 [Parabacteroides merdae]